VNPDPSSFAKKYKKTYNIILTLGNMLKFNNTHINTFRNFFTSLLLFLNALRAMFDAKMSASDASNF